MHKRQYEPSNDRLTSETLDRHWCGVASHQSMLLQCAYKTTGGILELGMGWASSIPLHVFAHHQDRYMYSFESNPDYAAEFRFLQRGRHKIIVSPDMDLSVVDDQIKVPISLVLIDCAPPVRRLELLNMLQSHGMTKDAVFILHDTEDPIYGLEPALGRFKYRVDDRRWMPYTTAVSDHYVLSDIIENPSR